jgi:uncharacterized LabA/DUF88 family protein
MAQWGGNDPVDPVTFQKAMIFVDGTNLFHRLADVKLQLTGSARLADVLGSRLRGRQLVRRCMYTTEPTLEKAKRVHGQNVADGFRLVFGDSIPKGDGNIAEKGVDALLVADLIYHAASRNCGYALVVTADTDFVHGLRRVEDFGCRTGVLGVCCEIPPRLSQAADDIFVLSEQELLASGLAKKLPG